MSVKVRAGRLPVSGSSTQTAKPYISGYFSTQTHTSTTGGELAIDNYIEGESGQWLVDIGHMVPTASYPIPSRFKISAFVTIQHTTLASIDATFTCMSNQGVLASQTTITPATAGRKTTMSFSSIVEITDLSDIWFTIASTSGAILTTGAATKKSGFSIELI